MSNYNAFAIAIALAEFFVSEGLEFWGMDPFLAACLVFILGRYFWQEPPSDPPGR